jgi:hypothetical protein
LQVWHPNWHARSLWRLCCYNEALHKNEITKSYDRGLPSRFWSTKPKQFCFVEAKWAWKDEPRRNVCHIKIWLLLLVLGFLSKGLFPTSKQRQLCVHAKWTHFQTIRYFILKRKINWEASAIPLPLPSRLLERTEYVIQYVISSFFNINLVIYI